jgi:carboxyl-terminal processing protease
MKNAVPSLVFARPASKAGAAKLTIQKFYLPDGHSTQLKGVVPDIVLPSIDDLLPVGEKDLQRALIWDEIPTSRFEGQPLSPLVLSPLQASSNERQKNLEEFYYLQKTIDWFKTKQEQKTVSLNIDERRQQREADAAFRKLMRSEKARLAKNDYPAREFTVGPPQSANIKAPRNATTDALEDEETEEEAKKLDIHLREALRIVNDAISLARTPDQMFTDSPPLTAQAVKRS